MGYAFSRTLTVDHTKVPANQSNFTVLVSLSDATLKDVAHGGHVQRSDGFDIVFSTAADGSALMKWEIESYDNVNGVLVAWVLVTSLSSSVDNVFYLVYDNSAISTFQGGTSGTAWDSNYIRVLHLSGSGPSMADTSPSQTTATNHGATAATGQIDGGAAMASASSQYVDMGNDFLTAAITYSGWFKFTSLTNAYTTLIASEASSGNTDSFYVKSNGKLAAYFTPTSGGINFDGSGSHTLVTGTWYLLSVTYDSSNGLKGYVNGAADGTQTPNGTIKTPTPHTDVGWDSNTSRYLNGVADEIHLSSTARSANWLTTEYNNQNAPGTFMTLGAETPAGASVSVALTAATAAFKSVAPSVILGSLSISLTPSTATAKSVAPTIDTGVALPPATAKFKSVNPSVILGSISVTPVKASAKAKSVNPGVTGFTSISVTPTKATMKALTLPILFTPTAFFLDVKTMRVVLGEAWNLRAICLERYGGGGDGNNEVQEVSADNLHSLSIVDDPTGGASGIITTLPSGAVVDDDGFIYSGQRNHDSRFTKFDPITNAPLSNLFTAPATIIYANWIPDSSDTPTLLTCCSDNPMTVHLGITGTLVATAAHQAASSMISTCYDGTNHLWVFYVNNNGTTQDTFLIDVGHTEYTLSGAAYGAYRAMWFSPTDQTLVFLTYNGYFVKWDVVTHSIVGTPTLVSALAGIGDQIAADMAKYATNENIGKLWITQSDGYHLVSFDLVTLAQVDSINLRTAFSSIPNFPSSTWTNTPPTAFLPRARIFVGWAEPGGSNHYTWYLLQLPVSETTNVLVSLNGYTHPFGQSFVLQDTVTGDSPTGTVKFLEGTTVLGSATLSGGIAVLTLPANYPAGTHTVHAMYDGDLKNGQSTSNDITLVVTTAQSIAYGTGSHSTTKAIKAHNQKYWFNSEFQRKLRHK